MLPETVPSQLAPAPVSLRDTIAEANHRIANNFTLVASMVRMHARALDDNAEPRSNEEVRALLEDIGIRTSSRSRGCMA
jgi:two-component sensor histidine kinase